MLLVRNSLRIDPSAHFCGTNKIPDMASRLTCWTDTQTQTLRNRRTGFEADKGESSDKIVKRLAISAMSAVSGSSLEGRGADDEVVRGTGCQMMKREEVVLPTGLSGREGRGQSGCPSHQPIGSGWGQTGPRKGTKEVERGERARGREGEANLGQSGMQLADWLLGQPV
ncbi:unnamed protein product [Protopolystoma xenopodis]|uniref:Uncharacterized protein n=1 Tax=Protopolystoma xenopodis TaxID=117903 RepID=A0A448XLS4_9PLAT|nr:unnamed protein product [Protopolystoma xenopodis]